MSALDRRTVLAAAAGAMVAPAFAQPSSFPLPHGFTRFPIWPGPAPGGQHVTVQEVEALRRPDSPPDDGAFTHIVTPTLTLLRPARPNGAALMLIPGGGYRRVAIGHEGYAISRRFAAAGYTCFVLLYRLPGDGWAAGAEAPLQDAQRALRVVRSRASQDGFDAKRIGVLGFSAGGHLAAWLTTRPVATYSGSDAIDSEPLQAAVAAYLYPVILMDGAYVHPGSQTQLLGANPDAARRRAYSLDHDLAETTPPAFLGHALDDSVVPPENSLAMLAALRARKVPTECHLFESGGHGFGVTAQASAAASWPDLLLAFARRHGV